MSSDNSTLVNQRLFLMKKKLLSRNGHDLESNYIKTSDIISSNKYHFTLKEIQGLIADHRENGLTYCLKQLGNRFLVNEALFDEWYQKNYYEEVTDGNTFEDVNQETVIVQFRPREESHLTSFFIKKADIGKLIKYLESLIED